MVRLIRRKVFNAKLAYVRWLLGPAEGNCLQGYPTITTEGCMSIPLHPRTPAYV
jgi:hypothetical protein